MNNLIHFAFNIILGKLYANMFVATLNQRLRHRQQAVFNGNDMEFSAHSGHAWHRQSPPEDSLNGRGKRFGNGLGLNVHITTTKETTGFPLADTPSTMMTNLSRKSDSYETSALDDSRNGSKAAFDEVDVSDRRRIAKQDRDGIPHFSHIGGEC